MFKDRLFGAQPGIAALFSFFFSFHFMTGSAEFFLIREEGYNYLSNPQFFLVFSAVFCGFYCLITLMSSWTAVKIEKNTAIIAALCVLIAADFGMSFLRYNNRIWLGFYNSVLAAGLFLFMVSVKMFKNTEEGGLSRRHALGIVGFAAAAFMAMGIYRAFSFYSAFFLQTDDFGVFLNGIWKINDDGTQATPFERSADHRGVHWQPVMYLLALVFRLKCSGYILLCLQVVFSFSAVIFLYLFAEKILADRRAAVVMSLAFLVSPYTYSTFIYEYHPESMYMIGFFAFLYFAECGNLPAALASFAFALAIKEEASIYMFFASILLFVKLKERKYLLFAAFSAVYGVAVIKYLIPAFSNVNGSFGESMLSQLAENSSKLFHGRVVTQILSVAVSTALLPLLSVPAFML
ncbi:MAG TPA: DUF2079 domain-containing protein, partial [Candidatus Goldiibacteriota bacterium]|nr:DUF2079 domain-containing protein [Candidatus Goldiibacteriota bacterium]